MRSKSDKIRWVELKYEHSCPNCGAVVCADLDVPFFEDEQGHYNIVVDVKTKNQTKKRLIYVEMLADRREDSTHYTIKDFYEKIGNTVVPIPKERWTEIQSEGRCTRCGAIACRFIMAGAMILHEQKEKKGVMLIPDKPGSTVYDLPIILLVFSERMHLEDMKFLRSTSR